MRATNLYPPDVCPCGDESFEDVSGDQVQAFRCDACDGLATWTGGKWEFSSGAGVRALRHALADVRDEFSGGGW